MLRLFGTDLRVILPSQTPCSSQVVAEVMYPSTDVVASGSGIALRLTLVEEATSLLALKYAHHVAALIDTDDRDRYEDSLAAQDNLALPVSPKRDPSNASRMSYEAAETRAG